SVAFHNFSEYQAEGHVRLFGGWDGYGDGGQMRDFVHVDDVVQVNLHFIDHPEVSGIFNCGSGRAQPFNDVASTVVNTIRQHQGESPLQLAELVNAGLLRYIPFPDDLKARYQTHTQADLTHLRAAGYEQPFTDVQTGVVEYVERLLALLIAALRMDQLPLAVY